jgi:integrase
MGQKNSKGSVSIVNAAGRIRLRWRYHKQRCSLNLFQYNKTYLQQAKKIAVQIEHDLLSDNYDATLTRYRPKAIQEKVMQDSKSLVEHFKQWVRDYRNMDCDRDIDYHSARSMMRRWGNFDETTVVQHFGREGIGAKTYNRRLTLLKAFFRWTMKHQITAGTTTGYGYVRGYWHQRIP